MSVFYYGEQVADVTWRRGGRSASLKWREPTSDVAGDVMGQKGGGSVKACGSVPLGKMAGAELCDGILKLLALDPVCTNSLRVLIRVL